MKSIIFLVVLLSLYISNTSAQRSYLFVLDAGSSGTKVLLYTNDADNCIPSLGMRKLDGTAGAWDRRIQADQIQWCKSWSITPKLATLTSSQVAAGKLFAFRALLSVSMDVLDDVIADGSTGVFAGVGYATAGNRIIDVDIDEDSFSEANDMLAESDFLDELHFNVEMRTISGTQEAFYEWIAINFEPAIENYHQLDWVNNRYYYALNNIPVLNFVSTGGASAQMGIHLPNPESATIWFQHLRRIRAQFDFRCNSQTALKNFMIAAVLIPDENVERAAWQHLTEDHLGLCAEFKCVALISFLAGESVDAGDAKCIKDDEDLDAVGHNLVGGIKETFWTFRKLNRAYQTSINHELALPVAYCKKPFKTLSHVIRHFQRDRFFMAIHNLVHELMTARLISREFYTGGNFGFYDRGSFSDEDEAREWCLEEQAWGKFFLHGFVETMFHDSSTDRTDRPGKFSGFKIFRTPGNGGAWTFGLATIHRNTIPCNLPMSHYYLLGHNHLKKNFVNLQAKITEKCKVDLTADLDYLTMLEQSIDELM